MTKKSITVDELAKLVQGEVVGLKTTTISRLQSVEEAEEGDITFLAKAAMVELLEGTKASAVIIPLDMECGEITAIKVKNPYLASAIIHNYLLAEPFNAKGIHSAAHVGDECNLSAEITVEPTAVIGNRVTIGDRVYISAGVVIGDDVRIGDDTIIRPNVTIEYGSLIGNRVIIHSGTVIGCDGYGYAVDERGCHIKRPQVGIVRIDDDVEIGANCCFDRAAYGVTWIKSGTKIDNLVHIAHNVIVGENCLLLAHVAIAGSTELGRNVVFGGRSAAKGHIKIGDGVMVAGGSGVTKNLSPGSIVGGMPAIPIKQWTKSAMTFGKIPDLRADVRRLTKEFEKMQDRIEE